MLELISNESAKFLIKYNPSINDSINIYIYGFQLFYSSAFTILSILLLSILLDSYIYGLIFLLFFIPIRLYSGGYHAKTYVRCYLCTNMCFLITRFLIFILPNNSYNIFYFLCLLLSYLYIMQNAPLIDKNQPLNNTCIIRNKRILKLIIIFEIMIIWTLKSISSKYAITATLVTLIVAVMIFIPKAKERRSL